MLRWQTAGESHGEALVAMIEGLRAYEVRAGQGSYADWCAFW